MTRGKGIFEETAGHEPTPKKGKVDVQVTGDNPEVQTELPNPDQPCGRQPKKTHQVKKTKMPMTKPPMIQMPMTKLSMPKMTMKEMPMTKIEKLLPTKRMMTDSQTILVQVPLLERSWKLKTQPWKKSKEWKRKALVMKK